MVDGSARQSRRQQSLPKGSTKPVAQTPPHKALMKGWSETIFDGTAHWPRANGLGPAHGHMIKVC